MNLLDEALSWAELGYYVFPIKGGTKDQPLVKDWYNVATTDPAQIRAWWTAWPDANIGCAPYRSGHFVFDVDPPLGLSTLTELETLHGKLPETFVTRTPRGGFHHWFTGDCKTTSSRLGPKIDTRGGVGDGLSVGYVLLPPSQREDGHYEQENDHEIAEGPAWISEEAGREREHTEASIDQLDLPANVERARNILQRYIQEPDHAGVAVEGSGGDDKTYRTACEVLNLGLSVGGTFEVLHDWNAACIPPWEDDELLAKIENAAQYAQNEQGAWAVAPAEETFAAYAGTVDLRADRSEKSDYHFRSEQEQDTRPPTQWLLQDIIPLQSIGFMYGDSESFKTFLALDMALGISAGVPTFGVTPPKLETAYIAGEGPHEIETKRRPAWRQARGITEPLPFYTIDTMPVALDSGTIQRFLDTAKAEHRHPKFLVIDTAFWFGGGLSLNDGKDVSIMLGQTRKIKEALGCTVLLVHHIGKNENLGMTGSRHLFGAADFVLSVKRVPNTLAVEVRMEKQKDAEKRKAPWYFLGSKFASGSLAFAEIKAPAFTEIAEADDLTSRTAVGRVLKALGMIAPQACPTAVLASELVRGHEDVDEHKLVKALQKETRLTAYRNEAGDWQLPAQD